MRTINEIDMLVIQRAMSEHNVTGWTVFDELGRALCGFIPTEGACPVQFTLSDDYFKTYGRR